MRWSKSGLRRSDQPEPFGRGARWNRLGILAKCCTRNLLLLACGLAVNLVLAANAAPISFGSYRMYESSYALLIGISEYENWPDLPSVRDDIRIVGSELRAQGFDVTEAAPDLDAIELSTTLKSFLSRQYGRDTRIVVYFSGHGWTDADLGYIVPADAPSVSDRFLRSKLTSMEEIKAWSYVTNAKHVLFVFDSCFSGSIFSTRSVRTASELSIRNSDQLSRQFISSGSESEEVPAISDFAPAFVAGLRGQADLFADGVVTASELGMWLVGQLTPLNKQTPQWGRVLDTKYRYGEMLFSVGRATPSQTAGEPTGDPELAVRSSALFTEDEISLGNVDLYYYKRPADGDVIETVLRSAGIEFQSQPSMVGGYTNVVTCAPDVPFEKVKALAATLIKSGVVLRGIARTVRPGLGNAITIDQYAAFSRYEPLTDEVLASLSTCPGGPPSPPMRRPSRT